MRRKDNMTVLVARYAHATRDEAEALVRGRAASVGRPWVVQVETHIPALGTPSPPQPGLWPG